MHDASIPRTHDLILLARHLEAIGLKASKIAGEAALLSEYGVLPRYPMPSGHASAEDAGDAIAAAAVILAWVERQFA